VRHLQPYRYADGLLEIPMMGISDIHAFRNLDLDRGQFLELLRLGVEEARAHGLIFSVLMHPHVQACRDPHGQVVKSLLDLVLSSGGAVVSNDALATQLSSTGQL
jgi:hypothetical protein